MKILFTISALLISSLSSAVEIQCGKTKYDIPESKLADLRTNNYVCLDNTDSGFVLLTNGNHQIQTLKLLSKSYIYNEHSDSYEVQWNDLGVLDRKKIDELPYDSNKPSIFIDQHCHDFLGARILTGKNSLTPVGIALFYSLPNVVIINLGDYSKMTTDYYEAYNNKSGKNCYSDVEPGYDHLRNMLTIENRTQTIYFRNKVETAIIKY